MLKLNNFPVPALIRHSGWKLKTESPADTKPEVGWTKEKDTAPENHHHWKVFVFFLPRRTPKPPKLPNGKNWLEFILLVIKVAAAAFALVKAIGVLQ